MNTLTTLEGLENGTDIGVQMNGGRVERWSVLDGGLVKNGSRVDAWMFSGYLAQNRVYLKDFSPPQVGEWFADETHHYAFHVLRVVVGEANRCDVAVFAQGSFYTFQQRSDLVDLYHRTETTPEWVNPLAMQLTALLWDKTTKLDAQSVKVGQLRDVQVQLEYIERYAQAGLSRLRS